MDSAWESEYLGKDNMNPKNPVEYRKNRMGPVGFVKEAATCRNDIWCASIFILQNHEGHPYIKSKAILNGRIENEIRDYGGYYKENFLDARDRK